MSALAPPTHWNCPPPKPDEVYQIEEDAQGNLYTRTGYTGIRTPAVYLRDVWQEFVQPGAYLHPADHGDDPLDVTSYLPSQQSWGPGPNDRPGILYRYQRTNHRNPTDPVHYLVSHGRIVLDRNNYPIRDFRLLPTTISSKIEGFRCEAICRLDGRIVLTDFISRMIAATDTTNNLQMRKARFRFKARSVAWGCTRGQNAYLLLHKAEMTATMIAQNSTRQLTELTAKEFEYLRDAKFARFVPGLVPGFVPVDPPNELMYKHKDIQLNGVGDPIPPALKNSTMRNLRCLEIMVVQGRASLQGAQQAQQAQPAVAPPPTQNVHSTQGQHALRLPVATSQQHPQLTGQSAVQQPTDMIVHPPLQQQVQLAGQPQLPSAPVHNQQRPNPSAGPQQGQLPQVDQSPLIESSHAITPGVSESVVRSSVSQTVINQNGKRENDIWDEDEAFDADAEFSTPVHVSKKVRILSESPNVGNTRATDLGPWIVPTLVSNDDHEKENIDPESGDKAVSAETSESVHHIPEDEFADLGELLSRGSALPCLEDLRDIPLFQDLASDAEVYWLNRLRMAPEDLDNPSLRERLAECLTNEWLRDREYAEDQARYLFGEDFDSIEFNIDPALAEQGWELFAVRPQRY